MRTVNGSVPKDARGAGVRLKLIAAACFAPGVLFLEIQHRLKTASGVGVQPSRRQTANM